MMLHARINVTKVPRLLGGFHNAAWWIIPLVGRDELFPHLRAPWGGFCALKTPCEAWIYLLRRNRVLFSVECKIWTPNILHKDKQTHEGPARAGLVSSEPFAGARIFWSPKPSREATLLRNISVVFKEGPSWEEGRRGELRTLRPYVSSCTYVCLCPFLMLERNVYVHPCTHGIFLYLDVLMKASFHAVLFHRHQTNSFERWFAIFCLWERV